MDLDIEFGELEEAQPEPRLRPDQDLHYAVVPCMEPIDGELPIFVSVDAMIDIETHAQTDTSVELGGVLLGGQYEDQDGNPFVVVHDCLRAEHYEATKGSFKFTHETWEQITRQREQFSDEFEMVGWYHTHPDWGVFLSSMDMFICDNFFNRPLDVALVVDPCRDDRGWFQWTGDPSQRVKRTGGFYLIGSRFRQHEIEQLSTVLEGKSAMSFESRMRPVAGQIGPSSPVVNIHDRQSPVQQYGVLGMLVLQFLFVGLIAWKILAPPVSEQEIADSKSAQEFLVSELARMQQADDAELRADAQREIVELLASRVTGESVDVVQRLEDVQVENARLLASLDGQISLTEEMRSENRELAKTALFQEERAKRLSNDLRERKKTIEELNTDIKALKDAGEDGVQGTPFYRDWRALLVGGVLMAVSIGCGFALGMNYRRYESEFEASSDELSLGSMEMNEQASGEPASDADPPSRDNENEDA